MAERARHFPKGMQIPRAETTPAGFKVRDNRLVIPRGAYDAHDTTLRDGWQKWGVKSTSGGKLVVAHAIDTLMRPNVIEAGWPGANPVDTELFQRLQDDPLQHAELSSFGMTVGPRKHVEDDPQLKAQIDSHASIKTIVGKADIYQVEHRGLKVPPERNLQMIQETMEYLKTDPHTKEVRFDAEHFFSGFLTDPEYALEALRAAARGGADMVVLCDTMGDAMPEDVELAFRTVLNDKELNEEFAKHHGDGAVMPIGMHAHNDTGLAIAHTLTALRLGAKSIQGTVTGIGERIGNANLQTLMLTRTRKYGTEDIPVENLPRMKALAKTVAANAGIELNRDLEYIGDNAANHKGGLHTAFVLDDSSLYEHDAPEVVGNERYIGVSAQNGARGILFNLEKLGLPFTPTKEFATAVTDRLKELDSQGYDYERANGSFDLLARRMHDDYIAPFTITTGESSSAILAINHNSQVESSTRSVEPIPITGNTETMFETLKERLIEQFPELADVDYLMTRIRPHNGTSAIFITATNGETSWTTTGVAESSRKDLATLESVIDALEYAIHHAKDKNA